MRIFYVGLIALLHVNLLAQSSSFTPIQNTKSYQVFLNLTALENDQLPVEIVPPILTEDSVEFHLPRIVPGTYDVHNYGQFVSNLTALGPENEKLEIKQLDKNRWRIYQAFDLYKITYTIDDTYDHPEETGIFEPAGTSIDDSVYLLNNFGILGYIAERKESTFNLQIKKPEGFYGSTALIGTTANGMDNYSVPNYFELHDSPILYCVPDTASMMVGNTKVLVSMFSPTGAVNADTALATISEVLAASADYLGGTLPVEKYAVLIYCKDPRKIGNSYGALEHQKSTVLYMPEVNNEFFYQGVRDITAHEFFHIITPLSIHSEYVHDFDFIDPKMSEHIWFFEGVTEYNSILVQVRDGIITEEEFLDQMRDKMQDNDRYNSDVPLTVASVHTLSFLKEEYGNFYQKGALAGMALDLKLRSLSEGDYGLPQLLADLGNTYGSDTFFVDANFFDIITEMTYPEMREFFALHYEGTEPFPFEDLLANAGYTYSAREEFERFSYGGIGFGYNPETERLVIESLENMDAFGEDMGYEVGDEFITFNEDTLSIQALQQVMDNFFSNTEEGDKIRAEVARPQEDGDYKTKKLKARAILTTDYRDHVIRMDEKPSLEAIKFRLKWINQ